MQGHVEAETVFLNSFFERQSGPRARLRRHSRAPKWLPSTPAQRSRAPKWLPSTPAQRSRAPKWLPSMPVQRFRTPKRLPRTQLQRLRTPKWLLSGPVQHFRTLLPSPKLQKSLTPSASSSFFGFCELERFYLYRYTSVNPRISILGGK